MSNIHTLSDFRNISTNVEQMVTLQGDEHSAHLAGVDKASMPDMAALRQDAVLNALKQALLSDRNYRGMNQTITALLDGACAEVAAAPQDKAVTGRDIQNILNRVDAMTIAASLETRVMPKLGQYKAPGPDSASRQVYFEAEMQNAYTEKARDCLINGKLLSSIDLKDLARSLADQWTAKDALVASKANSLSPESLQRLSQWHKSCSRSLEDMAETVAQLTWIDRSRLLPEDKLALYKACYDNGNQLARHDFTLLLTAAKDKALPLLTQKWANNDLSKESLELLLDKESLLASSPDLESKAIKALQRIDNTDFSETFKKTLRAQSCSSYMLNSPQQEILLTEMFEKYETVAFTRLCSDMKKAAAELLEKDFGARTRMNNKGVTLEKLEKTLTLLAKDPTVSLKTFQDISSRCSKLVNLLSSLNPKDMEMMFEIVCDPTQHAGKAVQEVLKRATRISDKFSQLKPALADLVDRRGYTHITHLRTANGEASMPALIRMEQQVNLLEKIQDNNIPPTKAACLYRVLENASQRMLDQNTLSSIDTAIRGMVHLEKAHLPDYLSYSVFCNTLGRNVSMSVGAVRDAIEKAQRRHAQNPHASQMLSNPWIADVGEV